MLARASVQLDGFAVRQRGVGERERAVRTKQVERSARQGDAGVVIGREPEQSHFVAQRAVGHLVREPGGVRHEKRQQLRQLGFRIEAITLDGHLQIGIVGRIAVQNHDHGVRPADHRRIGHDQFQAVAGRQLGRRRQDGEVVVADALEFDRTDVQRRAAAVGHRQNEVGRRPHVDGSEIQMIGKRRQLGQPEGLDDLGARIRAGAKGIPFRADAEIVQCVVDQAGDRLERAGHRAVGITRHVVGGLEVGRRGDVEAIAERAECFRPMGRERQGVGGIGMQSGRNRHDAGLDRRDGGIDLRIGHLVAGQERLVDDLGIEGRVLDPDLERDGHVLVRFQGEPGRQVGRSAARNGQDAAARAGDHQIVDPDDVRSVHAGRTDETDGRPRGQIGADVRAEMEVIRVVGRTRKTAQFRPAGRAVGGNLDRHVFVDAVQADALVVELQGGARIGGQVGAAADRLAAAGEAQRIGLVHAVVELDLDEAGRRAVAFRLVPIGGPRLRAVVVGIDAPAEPVGVGFVHGERSADPAALGDVGDAAGQRVGHGYAGLGFAAAVVDRQRVGDDVPRPHRPLRRRGFRQAQQRLDRLDRRGGGIVAGRNVHLVRRRERRHVGHHGSDGVAFDDRGYLQRRCGQRRQRADGPDAGTAVVGALTGHVREIDDSGRQEIRHFHTGRLVRSEVGRRHGIDHPAVHRRNRGHRDLAEADVHAGHGDLDGSLVVGHGQVRHVGSGDPRAVGQRTARRADIHRRGYFQLHGGADVEIAETPNAGTAVVRSPFGHVGAIGHARHQRLQNADAGRVGRPLVGHDQPVGHGIALVRQDHVRGLGDAEIRMENAVRHRRDDRRRLLVARHGRHVQQLGHGTGIDDLGLERDGQRFSGFQGAAGRQHRRGLPRPLVGAGPNHPGAVRHVDRAGGQDVFHLDPRVDHRTEVRHHDRIGDHVARGGVADHVGRLDHRQAADRDGGLVLVVARDRIRQIGRGDPAHVGDRRSERARFHFGHDDQRGRRPHGQRADGPRPRRRVVGALAGICRNEGQAVGQRFRDLERGHGRRPRVGQLNRIGHLRGFIGRRIVHGLGQAHVGAGDEDFDAVDVVGLVGVHLVVRRDGRHVGPAETARARSGHGIDPQGGGGPRTERADGPRADVRIVGALAGRVADVFESGRQRVGHCHAGCFVRGIGIADGQRKGDRLPFFQFGRVSRLRDG